jgi:hypothetical protein
MADGGRRISIPDVLLAVPASTLIEKANTEQENHPTTSTGTVHPRRMRSRSTRTVSKASATHSLAHRRPQLPLFPRLRRSLPLAGHFSWSSHRWRTRTSIDQSYVSCFRIHDFEQVYLGPNAQAGAGLLTLLQAASEVERASTSRVGSRQRSSQKHNKIQFVPYNQSARA